MGSTHLTRHLQASRSDVFRALLDPEAGGTGLSVTDNELGWSMSMDKLAKLVEPD